MKRTIFQIILMVIFFQFSLCRVLAQTITPTDILSPTPTESPTPTLTVTPTPSPTPPIAPTIAPIHTPVPAATTAPIPTVPPLNTPVVAPHAATVQTPPPPDKLPNAGGSAQRVLGTNTAPSEMAIPTLSLSANGQLGSDQKDPGKSFLTPLLIVLGGGLGIGALIGTFLWAKKRVAATTPETFF